MDLRPFSALHVLSAILLVGYTFSALAHPSPERRKTLLAITGALALVVILTGLHLWAVLKLPVSGWLLVKLACWLGIAALGGIAFRLPGKARALSITLMALVATALAMVYLRPF
jgi:hypothetical protein